MLKFEDKFSVGETILAYHFEPVPGRPSSFCIGKIKRIDMGFTAKCYVIDCLYDNRRQANVGQEVYIPMEVMFDYDCRIVGGQVYNTPTMPSNCSFDSYL